MSDEFDQWGDVKTAIVPIEDVPVERGAGRQAYLTVLAGTRVGEMMRVEGELTIGRGEDSVLRLADHGVSRAHLVVNQAQDGSVTLRDLQSSNGTYVNGRRVETAVLRDGDKIRIGSTAILKFAYADSLEETFQQRMYDAAVRDPLTGLYNRRHLMEQLQMEFSFVKRHRTPLALMMMDIDHFKRINDEHGHPVGDSVLHSFSERLRIAIRAEDLLARYGGEEFVLVCRGIRGPVGQAVADRLREVMSATPLIPEIPQLIVTFSAGVAAAPHPKISTPAELIAAADEALYEAKRSGRNKVCLYG